LASVGSAEELVHALVDGAVDLAGEGEVGCRVPAGGLFEIDAGSRQEVFAAAAGNSLIARSRCCPVMQKMASALSTSSAVRFCDR